MQDRAGGTPCDTHMQESMGLIRWRDGLERTPSGDLARELVMPRACSSAVWVTRDGTAYRRYYNSQTCAWTWGEALEVALDRETQDRVGYNLPTGWRSLELCIATAWLHRAEGSTRRVRILTSSRPSNDVSNLAWAERPQEGSVDLEGEEETWSALHWSIGIIPCDARYSISSRGRLLSPHTGEVTRGFAARGTRWAAVQGAGLVDLNAASGFVRAEGEIPPRTYEAYKALVQGITPAEHARRHGLRTKTAWDYFNVAAPLVPKVHLYGRPLVPEELWEVLESIRGTSVLGGPLKQLMGEVVAHLGHEVTYEELRLARTCLI